MPKSIEDILIYIHDRPGEDENTKLGRIAREVDVHLVTFGRNTTPERLRRPETFRSLTWGREMLESVPMRRRVDLGSLAGDVDPRLSATVP
jgi:hypothetical protein